jgi:hypothetical protein
MTPQPSYLRRGFSVSNRQCKTRIIRCSWRTNVSLSVMQIRGAYLEFQALIPLKRLNFGPHLNQRITGKGADKVKKKKDKG